MSEPQRSSPAPTVQWVLLGVATLAVAAGAWWMFQGTNDDDARSRGLSDYSFEDPARVYFGRPDFSAKPAVVNSSTVYAQIAEYQQILREGHGSNTPKYHLLMEQASTRFREAVKAAARAARHDAVAEVGTVSSAKAGAAVPPDITAATVSQLR